jgi:DNA-binding MarR family transcriptional regulator
MKNNQKPNYSLAKLEYISHLVKVRGMLKNANFPWMSPEEEKVLQNIAIDYCLDFEVSIEDLICVMPEMKPASINQGLNNLSRKGFIYFEENQQTPVARKNIKLTEIALDYLNEMEKCIVNLSANIE